MATITISELDKLIDRAGAYAAGQVGGYLSPLFPAQAQHQLELLLTKLNITEVVPDEAHHDQAVH